MQVKNKINIARLLVFIILLAGALTMVIPFVWMLSTSLKEAKYVYQIPPQWIPNPFDWENYTELWKNSNLLSGLKNSTIVSVSVVVFGTFSSSLSAFAFAKLDVPYKKALFMCVLSSMMIPFVVALKK